MKIQSVGKLGVLVLTGLLVTGCSLNQSEQKTDVVVTPTSTESAVDNVYKSEKLGLTLAKSDILATEGYSYFETVDESGNAELQLSNEINYILSIEKFSSKSKDLDNWMLSNDIDKYLQFDKGIKLKWNGMDAYQILHNSTVQITTDTYVVKNGDYIYVITYMAPSVDGIDCENSNNPNAAASCTDKDYMEAKAYYEKNSGPALQEILKSIKFNK